MGALPTQTAFMNVFAQVETKPRDHILQASTKSTTKDVNNKFQRDLKSITDKSHSDSRRKSSTGRDPTNKLQNNKKKRRNSRSESEPRSSDLIRNSYNKIQDSRDDEVDNPLNGLSKDWDIKDEKVWEVKEREKERKESDPRERSQGIVNRLISRLASDKDEKVGEESLKTVSKPSEKEEEERKETAGRKMENRKKEAATKEKVSNDAPANKELKVFKNTKSKVHERLKEQDTNVNRLVGLVGKVQTNNKWAKSEGPEKKDNLKRKLEKADERHAKDEKKEKIKQKLYFSKKQSSNYHQKPSMPFPASLNGNHDSGKKEEEVIFCNGVRVVVSKAPERKITLEKKNEKLEKKSEKASTDVVAGLRASLQVYTRLDGVSFILQLVVLLMIAMIVMICR